MQTPPSDDAPPRYYHLHLQEDLLEGWTLIREWGYQGDRGRSRKQHFDSQEAAQAALIAARDEQIRRGFRVVFIQGMDQH